MASAWLDVAVDWENPNGWNIEQLIGIIIDAYNERLSITQYNSTVFMPTLAFLPTPTGRVINNTYLQEINAVLETFLTTSRNTDPLFIDEHIYWTVDDFLTYKGLPLDLIPADFSSLIFDYRWITYWFYILNETLLLKDTTGRTGTGDSKESDRQPTFGEAISEFSAAQYSPVTTYISGHGLYDFFAGSEPEEDYHDIAQGQYTSFNFATKDQNNSLYQMGFSYAYKMYKSSSYPSNLMTWSYPDGTVFDITSFFVWNAQVGRYEAVDLRFPDVLPLQAAPVTGKYKWGTNPTSSNLDTRWISTEFNDENLIAYTPIV